MQCQTRPCSAMQRHLQPQSMSPRMPIVPRTVDYHILVAVGTLWSWRQSCWLSAELRYYLGHFWGTPYSTLSWSGCHSHDKDDRKMQGPVQQCSYRHIHGESVKQHNDYCGRYIYIYLLLARAESITSKQYCIYASLYIAKRALLGHIRIYCITHTHLLSPCS